MSENRKTKKNIMRESVRHFTKTNREGGAYSDERLNKFRTMLVGSGQDPYMVDLFISLFRDEIFSRGAK